MSGSRITRLDNGDSFLFDGVALATMLQEYDIPTLLTRRAADFTDTAKVLPREFTASLVVTGAERANAPANEVGGQSRMDDAQAFLDSVGGVRVAIEIPGYVIATPCLIRSQGVTISNRYARVWEVAFGRFQFPLTEFVQLPPERRRDPVGGSGTTDPGKPPTPEATPAEQEKLESWLIQAADSAGILSP